ncbi:MAG: tetratricopeptide repeat protein [Desulfatibacillaceae bacterium]
MPLIASTDKSRLELLAGAALLAVLAFAVYSPALDGGFVWDDRDLIVENPYLRSLQGLASFWASADSPDYYPLTYTAWWFLWRAFGDNPVGYHVVNVLLHALACVFLWRILARLAVPGAYLAALLFCAHPVNVASVAWIAEMKNTLSMCLGAGAALCFLRHEDEGGTRWYVLSLAVFALALLAKAMVAPLPVALLLFPWWRRGKVHVDDVIRSAPFFLLAGLFSLVTIWYHGHVNIASDLVREDGFLSRTAIAGTAVWFYLGKALVPVDTSFLYPRWETGIQGPADFAPLLLLGAALAALFRRRSGRSRGVLVAAAWYVAALSPVLGFFNVYFMRFSLVADHWQYLALPAPLAVVAAGVTLGARRFFPDAPRQARLCAGAALVAVFAALAFVQAHAWEEERTVWRDVLGKNPDVYLAHARIGGMLVKEGDLDAAKRHLETALELRPGLGEPWFELAWLARERGDVPRSIELLEKALLVDPAMHFAHLQLGLLLEETGRPAEARPHFTRAAALLEDVLRVRPLDATANNDMGVALLRLGELNKSARHFEKAIETRPEWATPRLNLGTSLAALERFAEAEKAFLQAVEIRPALTQAWQNLAALYMQTKQPEKAIPALRTLVRRDPGNPRNHGALAIALAATGRMEEARAQAAVVRSMDPGLAEDVKRRLEAAEQDSPF